MNMKQAEHKHMWKEGFVTMALCHFWHLSGGNRAQCVELIPNSIRYYPIIHNLQSV